MATAISVTNFRVALGELYDAIDSEDWSAAMKWYAKAEAQHMGLELSAGQGGANLARRQSLDNLKGAIDAAKSEAVQASDADRLVTVRTAHSA